MIASERDQATQLNFELIALFEQRKKISDADFMVKLCDFCIKLPSGLRVIFNLRIAKKPSSGLAEELRFRLEKAGILAPDKNTCQLVIQSPLIASGPISAADTVRANRYPFYHERFPDSDTRTNQRRGVIDLLQVDPTGMSFSIAQKFNVPASVISKVSVTSDKTLALSPALSKTG